MSVTARDFMVIRGDVSDKIRKIIDHAESLRNDEHIGRQYILEDMISRLDALCDQLDGKR
jgi:hypothetical protein